MRHGEFEDVVQEERAERRNGQMDQQSKQTRAWHALDLSSLEKSLDARPGGLTGAEAAERLVGLTLFQHAPLLGKGNP